MRVGLFTEVKVWRHRVLEEVHEEVAGEDQKRAAAVPHHRHRQHVHECGGEHEAGAQGHEVAQDQVVPVTPGNEDQAARDVGERSDQTEQQR